MYTFHLLPTFWWFHVIKGDGRWNLMECAEFQGSVSNNTYPCWVFSGSYLRWLTNMSRYYLDLFRWLYIYIYRKPFSSHFSIGLMYRKFPEFSDFRIHQRWTTVDRPSHHVGRRITWTRRTSGTRTHANLRGHSWSYKGMLVGHKVQSKSRKHSGWIAKLREAFSTLWNIINSDAHGG